MGCNYSTVHHRSFPPWSELPTDVLWVIAGKLNIIERGFFGSVCRSWRSVAKESSYPKDHWILLPRNEFLCCKSGKRYKSLNPVIRENSEWKCLVCSEGWLVMTRTEKMLWFRSLKTHLCLLNPFNSHHISLPTNNDIIMWCSVDSVSSSNDPLVVYAYFFYYLAFTRKENGGVRFHDWVPIKGLETHFDLTCHEGLVYAGDSNRLYVYRVDHDAAFATPIRTIAYPTERFARICGFVKVKECIMVVKICEFSKTKQLGWKLEEEDGNQYRWVPINDLGGKGCGLSLFLQLYNSYYVLPVSSPGFLKENHIYYVDSEIGSDQKVMSIDLEDGDVKTLRHIPHILASSEHGSDGDANYSRTFLHWIYA